MSVDKTGVGMDEKESLTWRNKACKSKGQNQKGLKTCPRHPFNVSDDPSPSASSAPSSPLPQTFYQSRNHFGPSGRGPWLCIG